MYQSVDSGFGSVVHLGAHLTVGVKCEMKGYFWKNGPWSSTVSYIMSLVTELLLVEHVQRVHQASKDENQGGISFTNP